MDLRRVMPRATDSPNRCGVSDLDLFLASEFPMPKNIVVFSDGTGQDGGVRPEQRVSNIYKMYRASRVSFDNSVDPAQQVTMYDPGLGTDIGATALSSPVRYVQKLLSSIDGRGITTNIVDCYTFIIDHYEDGDRIFLFGFSRGAYTVRSVADVIRLCGIPTKAADGQLLRFRSMTRQIAEEATLTVLEHGAGHPRDKYEDEREELARRFRDKYGSNHPSAEARRSNAAPYFVGVFDTVAALGASGLRRFGIQAGLFAAFSSCGAVLAVLVGVLAKVVWDLSFWYVAAGVEALVCLKAIDLLIAKQQKDFEKTIHDYPTKGQSRTHSARWEGKNFNRLLSRFVTFARSANAIDETRADFDRVKWGPTAKDLVKETSGIPTFKQFFFAGNHSDIGGSYPEVESRLSDIALEWMLEEAVEVPNGLRIGPVYVNGKKMSGSGSQGTTLYLYPSDDGVQHNEIFGMRDALDAVRPRWLAWILRNKNYAENIREIPKEAVLHPSVERRMLLKEVRQADGVRAYRPEALAGVEKLAQFYPKPGASIADTEQG